MSNRIKSILKPLTKMSLRQILIATLTYAVVFGLAIAAFGILFGLLKIFPPRTPEEIGAWAAVVGGAWALYRFGYQLRERSSDLLLELYRDFRNYLPLLGEIEDKYQYRDIEALLERSLNKQIGGNLSDWKKLKEIDEMLRHFLLLHCLDANGQIDRETIRRHYRYYALMLMCDDRLAMRIYVHRYFATLAGFLLSEEIFPDRGEHFKPRKIKRHEVESIVEALRSGSMGPEEFSHRLSELKARAAGR